MELHPTDRNKEAPRPLPSATVVMLRDGAAGLEVFLLRRNSLADVHGGAYVFPGGKVDRDDAELAEHLDQPLAKLQASLGEPDTTPEEAGALYVAAIREVFEESSVLFSPVDDARAKQAWALMREGHRFDEVLGVMGLKLVVEGIAPWSRWVTPLIAGVARKRFDARFFVAALPEGQVPVHDDHEATESIWLTPREALSRHLAGQIQFAAPQVMTLSHLARLPDTASVLREAASRRPPLVAPMSFNMEGGRMVCYPGDERHTDKQRAMPGPTRLFLRNERPMPEGGTLQELIG